MLGNFSLFTSVVPVSGSGVLWIFEKDEHRGECILIPLGEYLLKPVCGGD